jgi:hypothetical protein
MTEQPIKITASARTRFWEKIDIPLDGNACWPWLGALSSNGYGNVNLGGKTVRAHRVAWVLANGPIPDGMCVCHACDNPRCVNPIHLWLGTHGDNSRDMAAKGRCGGDQRGEANHHARLTDRDVLAIRRLAATGTLTQAEIGCRYGVTPSSVGNIVCRHSWRHLSEAGR